MWPREGFVGGFYFFLWVGSVGDEDQLIHQRRETDGRRKRGNHRIMELFGLEKPPSQAHLSRWHRDTAPHSCRPFPAVWDGKALLSRSFLPQGEGKQRLQQRGLKSSFCLAGRAPGCGSASPALLCEVFVPLMTKPDFRPCLTHSLSPSLIPARPSLSPSVTQDEDTAPGASAALPLLNGSRSRRNPEFGGFFLGGLGCDCHPPLAVTVPLSPRWWQGQLCGQEQRLGRSLGLAKH